MYASDSGYHTQCAEEKTSVHMSGELQNTGSAGRLCSMQIVWTVVQIERIGKVLKKIMIAEEKNAII